MIVHIVDCPFCKSSQVDVKTPYPGTGRIVQCLSCLASGPQKKSTVVAIRAWNISADSVSCAVGQIKKERTVATAALHYASDYLDENKQNSIVSGSKAHNEMRDALTTINSGDVV
jgi:hypothetical protein